jgi:type III secretory pathway lipoprotein EscJ
MELVAIRSYFDTFQANAHLALLENNGIEAFLENEDETVITGTHVKIKVLKEEAERARAILHESTDEVDEETE